ncbi:MAG: carotenoid oxygenase family protein [Acidobacteriota bacterium]
MTTSEVDHAPGLDRAFRFDVRETSGESLAVEGELPAFVRGSYYLNGPGRFERGGRKAEHWLDGDGLVTALHFDDGGVRFAQRFVKTAKLEADEAAGTLVHRGFGTRFEDDQLLHGIALEPPVNVSAYAWAGRLLAFGEQSLPYELDPETLETRELFTFGGRLNALSPLAAHPHVDPRREEMVDFGISFSPTRPNLQIYRFGADGSLLSRRRLPLEHPVSVHDFSLSARHATFYLAPYVLDAAALARDGRTMLEALAWRPELGSRLWILEHPSGDPIGSVEVDTGYCLHLINSFEQAGEGGREQLVVDLLEMDRPVYDQYVLDRFFHDARGARPTRFTIDLETLELVATQRLDLHWLADFPAIDPRHVGAATDRFWMLAISKSAEPGRKFFDLLVAADWAHGGAREMYRAERGRFLGGEPVFLPDPAADGAGAILCQELEPATERSAFLLFDATAVAAGPIARLPLPTPIPFGFHASFEPTVPALGAF